MSEENNSQNSNPPKNENLDASSEIQKLQEQAEKFKNDYLYLRAEFENYKRNAIKERSDLMKYGGERFIRELLEVVDNFERALQVNVGAENFNTYKQGVELTAQELKSLLQRNAVTEVPSHGTPFDPMVHEALGAEPSEQVAPGHILRVFKKPYKLHDKLIRPGQVVVAKKPE
ncbi:MAG: nucleotide exchange factor GrpE [Bdellovibrio sp.]|uniref:nucleotide exchange factor GrpE n=1 Tax=Bdellovibrio sp. TaxID=28201 RepID=UPI0039E4C67B|nr:nucleotide exchange factor GrpE [Bdellovibrio sp.]